MEKTLQQQLLWLLTQQDTKRLFLKKYNEVFSYSNKYLPKEIPVIHSFGGVVRRIFEGGEEETIIFTKLKITQSNVPLN